MPTLNTCTTTSWSRRLRVPSLRLPEGVRRDITAAIVGDHYARAVAACGEEAGMTAADKVLWQRLSNPQSPDFILDQPDYYCALNYYCALSAVLALGLSVHVDE